MRTGFQHCLIALTETTGKRAVQAFAKTVAKSAQRLKRDIKEFKKSENSGGNRIMIKKIFTGIAAALIMTVSAAAAPIIATQQDEDFATKREIRKKLVTLPYYGIFDNLAYKLEGDTVILSGQTVRPSTRKDAERRVRKIEGIDRVVDNIEVLPLSRFDDRIRISAFRAIFRAGSLYRYAQGANPAIHIIVK